MRVLLLIALLAAGGCADRLGAGLHTHRAYWYAAQADYDRAIAAASAALNYAPGQPALYTLRGQMRLGLYEWDHAEADFNRALALDPAYAPAYFQRGLLYYSILQTGLETRAAALADFARYAELMPGDTQAAAYIERIRQELEALAVPP